MEHAPTTWLLSLPFLSNDPAFLHVNGAIVVFLGILAFSLIAHMGIRGKIEDRIIPSTKFSIGTLAELIVESLYGLVDGIMGHHGREHFSFIAAIFIFILSSNLLGILPFSASPSTNTNTTFAVAILTFVYYNLMGIKSHGLIGYGKHFLMGLGILGLPIALIEMISHAIRPISLGVRLFLNLHVDHELLSNFSALQAWLLPIPLLILGLFVCTVQAFLFSVLSAVYIQMATEHE